MLSEISQAQRDKYLVIPLQVAKFRNLKFMEERIQWWLPVMRAGGWGKRKHWSEATEVSGTGVTISDEL